MTEPIDNSKRRRNDTKNNYAPFYLIEIFSFFQLIVYCLLEMLGKEGPIVQNTSSRGLRIYQLRLHFWVLKAFWSLGLFYEKLICLQSHSHL